HLVARADGLAAYRALPLPDTTEEHWRFTDLKGFDPDAFAQVPGTVPETRPATTMLELDVAGLATISEAGVEIERAPAGITFAPLAQEFFLEQGSKFEYVSIQNLSRETWHFATHHARVGHDAELDWVAGGFGSKKGKVRIQNDLAGEGATSRVTGAYFTDGDQHLDYDTFQEHIAPNTTSDFAFKGALRDTSTAVWRGMIRVEPEAQKTNAYQENRNLMLSPTTHAIPIPGLEILANDV